MYRIRKICPLCTSEEESEGVVIIRKRGSDDMYQAFEEGCGACGFWQCTGNCGEVGEWVNPPYYQDDEDIEEISYELADRMMEE